MRGQRARRKLVNATNSYQITLIEGVLRDAGVHFWKVERGVGSAVLGEGGRAATEFWVAAEDLDPSKDLLCANGIVCDVSERLVRRCTEELVEPLLSGRTREFAPLVRFVRINNRETVREIYHRTLGRRGGQQLLETLLAEILKTEPGFGVDLARALRGRAGENLQAWLTQVAQGGDSTLKRAAIIALRELAGIWEQRLLLGLLVDEDRDVREDAAEALYSIHGWGYGYDPDAPEERRLAAAKRWGRAIEARRTRGTRILACVFMLLAGAVGTAGVAAIGHLSLEQSLIIAATVALLIALAVRTWTGPWRQGKAGGPG